MGGANCQQHASADLAGVGAFLFPMNVLSTNRHVGALGCLDRGGQIDEGWANHDLVPLMSRNQGQRIAEEITSLVRCFVHLPIGSNDFLSHRVPSSMLSGDRVPDRCSFSTARV